MPKASASIRIKELRRVILYVASCMPLTMTIVKHCTTMPPTTQMGMEANAAPSFPMTPNTMSQPAHAKPAERDAQRVSAMTPLFWLKVVFGGDVKMHARTS